MQGPCQNSVGRVVVVAVEQVEEGSLRFDAELLPRVNWANGPAKAHIEGELRLGKEPRPVRACLRMGSADLVRFLELLFRNGFG
jgi:hypothetical protein